MKRTWDEHELVEHWPLFEPEGALLANRTGTGKLALAVLLKYFQLNGRFPRYHRDVPAAVLDFLAKQLGVEPASWFDYNLKGRSSKRDREQVRTFLGFRPITLEDEERLRQWLEHEAVALVSSPSFGAPERQQRRTDHRLGGARLRGAALRSDP